MEITFSGQYKNLKHLSLAQSEGREPYALRSILQAERLQDPSVHRRIRLESLRLSSFDVDKLFESLVSVLNLEGLAELFIFASIGAKSFFRDFGCYLEHPRIHRRLNIYTLKLTLRIFLLCLLKFGPAGASLARA